MSLHKLATCIVVSALVAILLASALNNYTRVADSALADLARTGGVTPPQPAPVVIPKATRDYLPIVLLNAPNLGCLTAGPGILITDPCGNPTISANFTVSGTVNGTSNLVARGDHIHFGQVWTGSAANGLNITNNQSSGGGVAGHAPSTGVFGEATDNSLVTFGLYGQAYSPNGYGIYGANTASNGPSVYGINGGTGNTGFLGGGIYGVFGQTYGNNGIAVYGTAPVSGVVGIASNSIGLNYGVYGRSNSTSGYGVWGTSAGGAGVYGESTIGYGVSGNSISNTGVYGNSGSGVGVVGTSFSGYGVYGQTAGVSGQSPLSAGVWGNTNSGVGLYGTSSTGTGVEGLSNSGTGVYGGSNSFYGVWGSSTSSLGVYGFSSSNIGVEGYSFSGAGSGAGVYGGSSSSWGVHAYGGGSGVNGAALYADASGSSGIAIYATSSSNDANMVLNNSGTGDMIRAFKIGDLKFRVDNAGNVYADGSYNCGPGPGSEPGTCVIQNSPADFAEMYPSVQGLQPGDVLVINVDGKLARSTIAYQTNVVGVYSTMPGYLGGGNHLNQKDYAPLALVGIVPVNVSAESGVIQPGDPLTSSSTPGVAMKATQAGKIIGYAMESANADGKILALVQPGDYIPPAQLDAFKQNAQLTARVNQLERAQSQSIFTINNLPLWSSLGLLALWLVRRRK